MVTKRILSYALLVSGLMVASSACAMDRPVGEKSYSWTGGIAPQPPVGHLLVPKWASDNKVRQCALHDSMDEFAAANELSNLPMNNPQAIDFWIRCGLDGQLRESAFCEAVNEAQIHLVVGGDENDGQ